MGNVERLQFLIVEDVFIQFVIVNVGVIADGVVAL